MPKDIHIILGENASCKKSTHAMYLSWFKKKKNAYAKIQTKMFKMYKPKLLIGGMKKWNQWILLLTCLYPSILLTFKKWLHTSLVCNVSKKKNLKLDLQWKVSGIT